MEFTDSYIDIEIDDLHKHDNVYENHIINSTLIHKRNNSKYKSRSPKYKSRSPKYKSPPHESKNQVFHPKEYSPRHRPPKTDASIESLKPVESRAIVSRATSNPLVPLSLQQQIRQIKDEVLKEHLNDNRYDSDRTSPNIDLKCIPMPTDVADIKLPVDSGLAISTAVDTVRGELALPSAVPQKQGLIST